MDDKILKELQEIVEKFDKDEYILNIQKIQENNLLRTNHFEATFSNALHEFKLTSKPTNMEYQINPTSYQQSMREYKQKCESFHLAVTTAKTLDLFLNKNALREQEDYKKKYLDLENKLKDAEAKIQALTEEKGFLKGKLAMYERDTPKSDTIESDVTND